MGESFTGGAGPDLVSRAERVQCQGSGQAKLQARLSQQGPLHPNQTLSAQHRSANTPFLGFATFVLARVITKC